MSFQIHHIFPIPLFSYKNFLPEEYLNEVVKLAEQHEFKNQVFPNESDKVEAGTTKNLLKQLPWLKDEITETFKEYAYNVLLVDMSVNFKIGSSWLVLTRPGCDSRQHIHPNYYYTGCLYLTENPSPINFFTGSTVYNHQERFQFKFSSVNQYNSNTVAYKPEKNEIIFFPSYLSHKISRNMTQENRYTLGFNIHPFGTYGDRDSTIHLEIIDDLD
jgi:uncharacterized protein (TIGR02466 family)